MTAKNQRKRLREPEAIRFGLRRSLTGALLLLATAGAACVLFGHLCLGAVLLVAPACAGAARLRAHGLVEDARASLERQGKCGLLVLSDSPRWREHIEQRWLPRMAAQLVVLNWSERSRWPRSPEVRLWRHLLGERAFCPAVVLLGPGGAPRVFRFYRAFLAAKYGDAARLVALEAELFESLAER